jgi:inorganic pyrophosphatase
MGLQKRKITSLWGGIYREELDAYILGVFEPLEVFRGKCIAVINRLNDNDDKLIVVPLEGIFRTP